jgi:hypothetical protein
VSDNENVVSSACEKKKLASLSVLGICIPFILSFFLLLHLRVQLKAHTRADIGYPCFTEFFQSEIRGQKTITFNRTKYASVKYFYLISEFETKTKFF